MKKLRNLTITGVIWLASNIYRHKKYTTKEKVIRVNLGCGLQCLPGWINVDGSLTSLFGSKNFPFINKILYKLAGSAKYYSFSEYNRVITECDQKFYNLTYGVPIHDGTADIVYCSHTLEHLTQADGQKFLERCFTALKSGGLLRIAVPDLEHAIKMYNEGKVAEMIKLFFYTSDSWDFAMHKHNYNFAHLKETLEKIGFKDVTQHKYREGQCPDIGYLDVYPEHSLYVECRK